jgi:DNA-binding CsgD family transcriptional regulator
VASPINGKQPNGRRAEEFTAPRYMEGVILLDVDLQVLGFDEGASTILKESHQPEPESERLLQVPPEILDALRDRHASDLLPRRFRIQLGPSMYICRIHAARSCGNGFPGGVTVLHLMRELSMDDALTQFSAKYHLTTREQQTLRGVLSGLTSKEVAEQMSISPNTVKSFLRLVMGKMGVSSRTGIVAKLFEPNGHG